MLQLHHITLGQRAFLQALQELVKEKIDLIKGATVAMKRNAADDLVIAVIIPSGSKLPPATREQKKADRESR
jgi:hypothetical protein